MSSSEDTISQREQEVIDKLRGAAEEMGALPWEVTADSVMAGSVRHRRLGSPVILRVAVVVFVATDGRRRAVREYEQALLHRWRGTRGEQPRNPRESRRRVQPAPLCLCLRLRWLESRPLD